MTDIADQLRAALSDTGFTDRQQRLLWNALREMSRLRGELRLKVADEQVRLIQEAMLQRAIDRTPARQGKVQ
jgi:hypothetical protein